MKKVISLFSTLLVFAGLKAQNTEVKKETTVQKPVPAVKDSSILKATTTADSKAFKNAKLQKDYKLDNSKLQKDRVNTVDKAATIKVTDKVIKR